MTCISPRNDASQTVTSERPAGSDLADESGTPDTVNVESGNRATRQATRLVTVARASYPHVGAIWKFSAALRAHGRFPLASHATGVRNGICLSASASRLRIVKFVDVSRPPAFSPHCRPPRTCTEGMDNSPTSRDRFREFHGLRSAGGRSPVLFGCHVTGSIYLFAREIKTFAPLLSLAGEGTGLR